MAWPNPFRRHTDKTVVVYDYTFEWTDEHLSEEACAPLRQTYDELAERVYLRLNELSPPPPRSRLPRNAPRDYSTRNPTIITSEEKAPQPAAVTEASSDSVHESQPDPAEENKPKAQTPKRDLYELLKQHKDDDPLLKQFWDETSTVPEWMDWAQIARGQDVFYRYGGANLTGLAYQSLVGGMGAARVAETLARTGGFSSTAAYGRLLETTQHILQCTKSLESMQPGGEGWASTLRVRLLHAAVRHRIMSLAKTRPEYYSAEKFGIPINDLDSIATISVFSASLIWQSLPRQGIHLRAQETSDYLALWRYIGYVIGSPTEPYFTTPSRAKATMESLYKLEVHPSDTSRLLAMNVIRSIAGRPPAGASAEFLIAGARWLNGPKLGDALGLPRQSLYYTLMMAGQCLFFAFWSYTNRSVEAWDRRKIEWLRGVFWDLIVQGKFGLKGEKTTFDFQHVPELDTVTDMIKQNNEIDGQASLLGPGVERRNIKTLLVGVAVMGIGSWCALSVVSGLYRLVFA